jgi:thiosulfate dehydrogenase
MSGARAATIGCALTLSALAGCETTVDVTVVHVTALERGRALFEDVHASPSTNNHFACSTCHPGEPPTERLYTGAPLGGATARTSFWGGARRDLLEAINDCRVSFMDAHAPWTSTDESAVALFAYLQSLPGSSEAVPFTVTRVAGDLPAGDPVRGRAVYAIACETCHGAVHTGTGRLAHFIPVLPDEVDASHTDLSLTDRRLVFLRKVREGAFVSNTPSSMAPFSLEVLSDADLAAVLALLGQY